MPCIIARWPRAPFQSCRLRTNPLAIAWPSSRIPPGIAGSRPSGLFVVNTYDHGLTYEDYFWLEGLAQKVGMSDSLAAFGAVSLLQGGDASAASEGVAQANFLCRALRPASKMSALMKTTRTQSVVVIVSLCMFI